MDFQREVQDQDQIKNPNRKEDMNREIYEEQDAISKDAVEEGEERQALRRRRKPKCRNSQRYEYRGTSLSISVSRNKNRHERERWRM